MGPARCIFDRMSRRRAHAIAAFTVTEVPADTEELPPDSYVTIVDAARFLGISRERTRYLVSRGELASRRRTRTLNLSNAPCRGPRSAGGPHSKRPAGRRSAPSAEESSDTSRSAAALRGRRPAFH
jgi:hypothetical protein